MKVAAVELVLRSIRHDPLSSIVQVADQQVDDQNLGPGITRRGGFRFIFAPFRWPRARVIAVNS